jgi:N-acetylglutamate synthase
MRRIEAAAVQAWPPTIQEVTPDGPADRRTGLGSALLRALVGRSDASLAYLQVEEENTAARALYARLGFNTSYSYCHRRATD